MWKIESATNVYRTFDSMRYACRQTIYKKTMSERENKIRILKVKSTFCVNYIFQRSILHLSVWRVT